MVHLPPLTHQISNTMDSTAVAKCKEKLPSLKSVCQEMMIQEEYANASPDLRHHFRARSLPTTLPSNPHPFTTKKRQMASSMNILLNAIALDEKMGSMYKQERVKNFVREQQWLHKTQAAAISKPRSENSTAILIRPRSRSAPGAPMAHYYHHVALSTARWYLPNHDDDNFHHDTHDIAYSLVQQHLKKSTIATFKK